MKTGKAPHEGMWENHKIQLAAYMMILKEKEQREIEGVMEYGKDQRMLMLNPFIEDKVKELTRTVIEIMQTRKVPQAGLSENKCNVCGLKKYCEHLN